MEQPKVFIVIDYSDKSFAIAGDTKPISGLLNKLNAEGFEGRQFSVKYNKYLKVGPAWIGSSKSLENIKSYLTKNKVRFQLITFNDYQNMNNKLATKTIAKIKPKVLSSEELIEVLYENNASFVAAYLDENNIKLDLSNMTLFIPSNDAIEYVQGLLRGIDVNVLLDVLLENHISEFDIELNKTQDIKMLNGNSFKYDRATNKLDKISIVKTISTKNPRIYLLEGILATPMQHQQLNRS